jgi:hypothetical protein
MVVVVVSMVLPQCQHFLLNGLPHAGHVVLFFARMTSCPHSGCIAIGAPPPFPVLVVGVVGARVGLYT